MMKHIEPIYILYRAGRFVKASESKSVIVSRVDECLAAGVSVETLKVVNLWQDKDEGDMLASLYGVEFEHKRVISFELEE